MELVGTALHRAAESGDVPSLTQALREGDININAKDGVRIHTKI
jgi:hypothetical protein